MEEVIQNNREVTPMPKWLERQFENAERALAGWSGAKCVAAGIPRDVDQPEDWLSRSNRFR